MSDLYSLVAGIALGLSLGVPPGPVNAAIAAAAARRSYVDGIKIGLGAMTADATYLVLTLIGVAVLLTGTPGAQRDLGDRRPDTAVLSPMPR